VLGAYDITRALFKVKMPRLGQGVIRSLLESQWLERTELIPNDQKDDIKEEKDTDRFSLT